MSGKKRNGKTDRKGQKGKSKRREEEKGGRYI